MCKEKSFAEVRSSAIDVLEVGIGFLQDSSGDSEKSMFWFQRVRAQVTLMCFSGLIDYAESEVFDKRISDIYFGF